MLNHESFSREPARDEQCRLRDAAAADRLAAIAGSGFTLGNVILRDVAWTDTRFIAIAEDFADGGAAVLESSDGLIWSRLGMDLG